MSPSSSPLSGVTILDLTRLPPGAFCTVLLADLGADVIRLETPAARRGPVALSRGKRSVSIDLRHPRGREVLRHLAGTVDVLVENDRPGAMDDRGFGWSQAAVELPRLIWCSITGFGQDGPYSQWSGHDLTYAAHSGLLDAINPELPWDPQVVLPVPFGATMAAVGILSALRQRDLSGTGCQIDISLSEAATWLLSSTDDAFTPHRRGIPGGPDRRVYPCAEGTWIAVTSAEPRTWNALCAALGLEDLLDTVHRWADPDDVGRRLGAAFAGRRADEWVAELAPLGASVVRANRGDELLSDPQAIARGSLQTIDGVVVPRSPIRFRDADGPVAPAGSAPVPALGADTRRVLLDSGMDPAVIDDLLGSGAISEG